MLLKDASSVANQTRNGMRVLKSWRRKNVYIPEIPQVIHDIPAKKAYTLRDQLYDSWIITKGVTCVAVAGAGLLGAGVLTAGAAMKLEEVIEVKRNLRREKAKVEEKERKRKWREKALWEVSNQEKYMDYYRQLIREEVTREVEQKLRREMIMELKAFTEQLSDGARASSTVAAGSDTI